MNRLINCAPTTVEIDRQAYPINPDWVACLKTVLALQDASLTRFERVDILLYNLYEQTPHDALAAAEKALWFLRCGREDERETKKLCDFAHDGDFIYNAMLKKGVDLDKATGMHWWTFMAHFAEIPESTFTRIVYLRSQRSRGKLTKEEKAECARIGWDTIDMPAVVDDV